jgi:hypothetical protein
MGDRSLTNSPGIWSAPEGSTLLTSLEERPEEEIDEIQTVPISASTEAQDQQSTVSPQRMFDVFIAHLGPSMV